jgi:hypothetical protein
MKMPKPPTLQVLFEPWPARANADRGGSEAFAGQYLLDALDETGAMQVRGFRAVVQGCTTCRRDSKDERAHWPDLNDLPGRKKMMRCPQWKRVEAVVKAFGGWKRVHYVELAASEGLGYQPIPQRRRVIEKCETCKGTGYGEYIGGKHGFADCPAGCGTYTYRGRGEVRIAYEGPVRPDRHGMTGAQRRKRRACDHWQCPADTCQGC